ncbi:MAG: aldo/keto reductase, partial [Acidobacteriota bacterium]
ERAAHVFFPGGTFFAQSLTYMRGVGLDYRTLGATGIRVSRLCFGVLTMGPLQQNLGINEGAGLIDYAIGQGINFFDTAESYLTYPYIKEALLNSEQKPVIASKSYAYTWEDMKHSVQKARDEMELPMIDIFLLHEQENELTLEGHKPALEYLIHAKKAGLIKAIGLSTHAVAGVMAGAECPDIEIIHPLINQAGLGIIDGTAQTMTAAIAYAAVRGKGVYAMKTLGGGNLIGRAYSAFRFVDRLLPIASMAMGMKSRDEIDLNLAWIAGKRRPDLEEKVGRAKRRLIIEPWCTGCGACAENCRYQALLVNEQATVEPEKCILCGYCAGYCKDFCIKIV